MELLATAIGGEKTSRALLTFFFGGDSAGSAGIPCGAGAGTLKVAGTVEEASTVEGDVTEEGAGTAEKLEL